MLYILCNRKQRVKINNSFSDEISVTSGVPQGSHLGPALFTIFINDIGERYDPRSISNWEDTYRLQGGDIDVLLSWCQENKLVLNKYKCLQLVLVARG